MLLYSLVYLDDMLIRVRRRKNVVIHALTGGGGGIRTLVTGIAGETVFETAAFSRSATLPRMIGAKPRMKRASGARE